LRNKTGASSEEVRELKCKKRGGSWIIGFFLREGAKKPSRIKSAGTLNRC